MDMFLSRYNVYNIIFVNDYITNKNVYMLLNVYVYVFTCVSYLYKCCVF